MDQERTEEVQGLPATDTVLSRERAKLLADEAALKPDLYHTDDGVLVTPSLRVFTNDWEWGTVLPEQFKHEPLGLTDPGGRYFDGWFRVRLDSMGEGGYRTYNRERMTTVHPDERPENYI